jgi:hypothetical protein
MKGSAMNALFIYPGIPETFWSFKYALEYVSKKISLSAIKAAHHCSHGT